VPNTPDTTHFSLQRYIPADKPVSRISCRFGSFDPNRQAVPHPGPHVPVTLNVPTFVFAHFPHPPFNPKYTKFKNVVRPCATSTDLLKVTQLLFVTIIMTTITEKKREKKRNEKTVSINYNIKSADKVPGSQYFYWTYIFFAYFAFIQKFFQRKKNKTEKKQTVIF
jgi:hypothetical protein